MAGKSNIEWCTDTWNPVVGCSIVSPGCTNCYAMKMAARVLDGNTKTPHYKGTTMTRNGNAVWSGNLALAPEHILTAPLHWKKPRRIFVNSMGDLFHESVPDEWIDQAFAVMALCPQHTFQVLTKRSKRMREYVTNAESRNPLDTSPRFQQFIPFTNLWLGVSAEDQQRANERIPDLLGTPVAVRFVSYEPALGPLQIPEYMPSKLWNNLPSWKQPEIDWIICGGESGSGARPMNADWARSILEQCKEAGVPFFMKQMGGASKSRMPAIPDDLMVREFPK